MKQVLMIPCFNFEKQIEPTLSKVEKWHAGDGSNFSVCFIDDGSTDLTAAKLSAFCYERLSWCSLLRLEKNSGKGAALKAGFLHCAKDFDYIFFTDCDLHYGLSIFNECFAPKLSSGADLVMAERIDSQSRPSRQPLRRLTSFAFHRFVYLLSGVNVRDSQAGCKGFRTSSCLPIFEMLQTRGFAVDVEILSIAIHYQLKLVRVPIRFEKKHDFPKTSTVRILSSSLKMFAELLNITFRWWNHRYESEKLSGHLDSQFYWIK